ncbi:hypothetical protein [Thermogemmatispora onikobensis]|uniref:hypothetical protein n=1 Tax=Thermogemmatispora onikobensis TaxID=732234 RepID=UPI000852C6AF|nr:hypothetical protein [Thermogemmatispora onikobensis]
MSTNGLVTAFDWLFLETLGCGELRDDHLDEPLLTRMLLLCYAQFERLQRRRSPVSWPFHGRLLPRRSGLPSRLLVYRLPVSERGELSFVGFIGKKQAQRPMGLDEQIQQVDLALIGELTRFPELVSYASLQLGDGNWSNLVLFAQPSLPERLRASEQHRHAAFELAPYYYEWIRLHYGLVWPGERSPSLQFRTTRYYLFQGRPPRPLIQERQRRGLARGA